MMEDDAEHAVNLTMSQSVSERISESNSQSISAMRVSETESMRISDSVSRRISDIPEEEDKLDANLLSNDRLPAIKVDMNFDDDSIDEMIQETSQKQDGPHLSQMTVPNPLPIYYSSGNEEDVSVHLEVSNPMDVNFREDRDHIVTQQNVRRRKMIEDTKDPRIEYETLQWTFIFLWTLFAVVDRYTTNYCPLWVDSPGPTIPGNPGATIFSVATWVSGRMLLVSSSYIFLFQNHVFWNWFAENKTVSRCIKIGDIRQSNTRLHYHVGIWFVGIPVMLHAWTILVAAAFPQNEVKFYDSWIRPDFYKIPYYSDGILSMAWNDVYRITSTTITFVILIPYSVLKCCRNHNWSFAQWVHLIGAILYTVDLLRMGFHPHSWIFNVPFILWWICDRIYGIFWYRRFVAVLVQKTQLDDHYAVFYLRVPKSMYNLRGVGDVCWFNILDAGWDRAHPFTVFTNHKMKHKLLRPGDELRPSWTRHKFKISKPIKKSLINDDGIDDTEDKEESISKYYLTRKSTELGFEAKDFFTSHRRSTIIEEEEGINDSDFNWNLGIIAQIIPDHADCYRRKTWTSEIQKMDPQYFAGLRTWGPYRSEYRILQRIPGQRVHPSTPIVLIGTGAGCSYLLDFYFYITANKIPLSQDVVIYFSARSIALFQWFTDITCHREHPGLRVNAHLTSHDNVIYESPHKLWNPKSRDARIGRMSLKEIFDAATPETQVFYCGSSAAQNIVYNLCKQRKLKYHAGHAFN